jgi:hypothetical protein
MIKKALLALFLLALAIPAFALPPQCSCPYCAGHGTSNCTIVPGNTVTYCGTYFGSHCTGPNLLAPNVPPSKDQFLASLKK